MGNKDAGSEQREWQVASLLSTLTSRLAQISDTPRLDAQVLLAHILGKTRSWVFAHPEAVLTPVQYSQLESAASQLQAGRPLPYLLGRWEFYGLEFLVAPQVLIPRPETELLVEGALDWLNEHPGRRKAADIGTGSGCIAVSLAVNIPDLDLLATDLSQPALLIARTNAIRHQVTERIHFLQADLLNPSTESTNEDELTVSFFPLDLLCANLPYIPTPTLHGLKVYDREPTLALDGGLDGLDFIHRLLAQAPGVMAADSLLLLEIEAGQGAEVRTLAENAFPQARVQVTRDLAGRDRLLEIHVKA